MASWYRVYCMDERVGVINDGPSIAFWVEYSFLLRGSLSRFILVMSSLIGWESWVISSILFSGSVSIDWVGIDTGLSWTSPSWITCFTWWVIVNASSLILGLDRYLNPFHDFHLQIYHHEFYSIALIYTLGCELVSGVASTSHVFSSLSSSSSSNNDVSPCIIDSPPCTVSVRVSHFFGFDKFGWGLVVDFHEYYSFL